MQDISKLQIELALISGQLAKDALSFTDPVSSGALLKLRYKQLIDRVEVLRLAIVRAIEILDGGK
jgi:hypothetical protein